MIIAQLMPGVAGGYQARFIFEGGEQLTVLNFQNTDQVQHKVDILNRDYLVKILTSWLNQRAHAMGNTTNREYPFELLRIVKWYKHAPLKGFIKIMHQHKGYFLKCIPGTQRPTYKHYEKEIKPWLNFCLGLSNGN